MRPTHRSPYAHMLRRTASFTPRLFATLALALPVAAQETTSRFFVSPSGNDKNVGSKQRPWLTLSHAAKQAPTGSTIYASGRGYTDTVVVSGKRLRFVGMEAKYGPGPTVGPRRWAAHAIRAGSKTLRVHAAFIATGPGTVLDIERFNIRTDREHRPNPRICVVFTDGASGSVHHCWMGSEPNNNGFTLDHQLDQAVAAWGRDSKTPAKVEVSGNWLWGAKDATVSFRGAGLSGSVRHNTLWAAQHAKDASSRVGIEIDGGNDFSIFENTFRNYRLRSLLLSGHAIQIRGGRRGQVSIRDNLIRKCEIGISYESARPKAAEIVRNRISDAKTGLIVNGSAAHVESNDFECWQSMKLRNVVGFRLHANRYGDFRANPGWPREYRAPGAAHVRDSSPVRTSLGFEAPLVIQMPKGSRPSDMAVGDFDSNGSNDFAIANTGTRSIRILLGSSSRKLDHSGQRDITLTGKPLFVVGGEFSGTRGRDLAAIDERGRVTILTNNGRGKFTAGPPFDAVSNTRSVGITVLKMLKANLDGRETDDLVIGVRSATAEERSDRLVLLTNSRGRLQSAGSMSLRELGDFAVVDLDRNGRDDIVAVDNPVPSQALSQPQLVKRYDSGRVTRHRLNGARKIIAIEPTWTYLYMRNWLFGFAAIDDEPEPSFGGISTMYHGFRSSQSLEPGASQFVFVDLQKDSNRWSSGKDLLILNRAKSKATIYEKRLRVRSTPTGLDPSAVVSTDVNGDGLADLVFTNRGDDSVSVVLSRALAFVADYGHGCWVGDHRPYIAAQGMPTLGNRRFRIWVSGKSNRSAVLLCSSIQRASNNTCQVQIGAPSATFFARLSDRGDASIPIPMPAQPSLIGTELFFQALISEPLSPIVGSFAMSQGLRVRIGDPIWNY